MMSMMRGSTRLLMLAAFAVLLASLAACSGDDDNTTATPTASATASATATSPAPSPSPSPTATATSAPAPTETSTPEAATPAAPTDATLTGRLPDLNTPVPPGEGEAGRLTIHWTDNSDDETGFHVYNECNGAVTVLFDLPADTEQYGPFQSCRPGRVGIASFNAAGASDIVWAVPDTGGQSSLVPVDADHQLVPAPIESAETAASAGGAYSLNVTATLPDGCAQQGGYEVQESGNDITVSVYNLVPRQAAACTQVISNYDIAIPLPNDLIAGQTYAIAVNDKTLSLTP